MSISVYLVFALLLVAIGNISAMDVEEMKKMIQTLHDNCVEETGVDEVLIKNCEKPCELPDDPKLKCYMKCLMTTVAIMDDGEVDVETAASMIPEEYKDIAEPIVRACGTVKGADDCETAFLTNKCWQSKAPEADLNKSPNEAIVFFCRFSQSVEKPDQVIIV